MWKKSWISISFGRPKNPIVVTENHLTRGFKVFVTIPGVITSKVPFWADPTFRGEHNFYIHGIHVIKVI